VTCATPLLGKIICAPARLSQEEASSAIVCQKFSGPCDLSHAHFGESYLFMRLVGIPYAKLRTKFEVSSWSSIEDMFDRMPKIEGSREQGHAPFMEKLFMRQLGFPKAKLLTKFEVSGSCSFEVMFDCMPKIWGVTWHRPRPFWGKLLALPLGFSKMKLYTKFEVPKCSNIFEDIWDRLQEILGVTCPRPRPFWFKLFERPLGFPQKKLCTKFEVVGLCWNCMYAAWQQSLF